MQTRMSKGAWWFFIVLALAAFLPACNNNGTPMQAAAVSITTTSVPDGVTGQAYNQALAATGGATPLSWMVSAGALPDGLALDASTGAITGTPTTTGTFDFTVEVSDSSSPAQTATQAFTVHVADPLAVTTTSLANGSDGAAYSQTVATTGGLAPLSFSVSSGTLPGGLALNATTGDITGTPTSGGSFDFTIRATDSLDPAQTTTQDYTVLILQITTTSLPDGVENQAYGPETLAVTGQVDPVTWAISAGALPAGLSLNSTTGDISGTPTATGSFNFTAQVTDSDSPARSDTQALSIDVGSSLAITTTSLPDATPSTAYNQSIQATGGTSPYIWSEPTDSFDAAGAGGSGTACEGLTFDVNATGASTTVSGTPVNSGTCGPFTARIDDSGMPAQFDEQSLSITVGSGGGMPAPLGVGERVSLANDGSQADNSSDFSSASADGRFVAFESDASNLVSGDTNSVGDIFVRDTCQGATSCTPSTIRVSVANDGSQADGGSTTPAISADGRFIAFRSLATNLVAGDTNNQDDIFVRDTCQGATSCTPATIRASLANDGSEADDASSGPAISADGRFIAFVSRATNLVASDTNNQDDIFVRDTCQGATSCTPATIRASLANDGSETDNYSAKPTISADGRFVAFESGATNLVANDTNSTLDVFVRDTCRGATSCTPSTIRVSVANDGSQGNNGSDWPAISATGRFVSFISSANNLVAGAASAAGDVFVRDTCFGATGCTPSTTWASPASDGSEALSGTPLRTSISANGRFVAFDSDFNNLVTGDTNILRDVFVRDTCLGATGCTPATVRVSVASDSSEGNGTSLRASISADGRFVAFTSFATNLVANDTNGATDVFLAGTGF